ncbi:MAG: 3-phosphoshikimate 1-carboxyvinyltransferase, partial [Bacteroidaceae bacterium]|nr:3-phosphoshikimate 1-carboxyvinyltransferase [Bacteroidaceae bacterium]
FPPLRVTGRGSMRGMDATTALVLAGDVSSQFISALLMIAPMLRSGLTLTLEGTVVSRPYIDMTLRVMQDYGAQCRWSDERTIRVEPSPYEARDYAVENDWSAASYWYEMVALSEDEEAEVVLPGLFRHSMQGDAGGAELFRLLGVETTYTTWEGEPAVTLRKGGRQVSRLDYDFVEMPDLAQTFAVTCCILGIPFHFKGLRSLRIKETDRIRALRIELRKLGYAVVEHNDFELAWDGTRCVADANPCIDTYEDHRMAMAFAPAALRVKGLSIRNPQVVSKSYPTFWESL